METQTEREILVLRPLGRLGPNELTKWTQLFTSIHTLSTCFVMRDRYYVRALSGLIPFSTFTVRCCHTLFNANQLSCEPWPHNSPTALWKSPTKWPASLRDHQNLNKKYWQNNHESLQSCIWSHVKKPPMCIYNYIYTVYINTICRLSDYTNIQKRTIYMHVKRHHNSAETLFRLKSVRTCTPHFHHVLWIPSRSFPALCRCSTRKPEQDMYQHQILFKK